MNAVRLTVRGLLLAACFCLEAVYLLSFESSRFGLSNYFFWVYHSQCHISAFGVRLPSVCGVEGLQLSAPIRICNVATCERLAQCFHTLFRAYGLLPAAPPGDPFNSV